jgi:DNA polymerase elongation subunit (family B)
VFGFENVPDIYHAMLFQMDNYLTKTIESKLKLRSELKELIKTETNIDTKQVYEIKAELIKLMLNSCYGFTLCNLTSSKFKTFTNLHTLPKHKKRKGRFSSIIQLQTGVYLAESKKIILEPFETLLGHVGCAILFNSKIILLKRLYFLLKYLNPTKAQLLYMDTDSAHFLVKHKLFEDNVDNNLQHDFKKFYDKHFETGSKISGIWVQEGFFDYGDYKGEKCYVLSNSMTNTSVSHMKGLNTYFQQQHKNLNINVNKLPCISYNIFYKSPDFAIYKTYMSKNLFSNYIPIKRYFVSSSGSLPLKIF